MVEKKVCVKVSILSELKYYRVEIDGLWVQIPISAVVHAHYLNQFLNGHQKRRRLTLESIVRAAYRAGLKRGKLAS